MQAPRKTVLTCAQAFEQYLSWCEKRRKLNTYRQKAFIIRSLITHLQHNPSIDNLTETNIESYLDFRFKTTGGKSANRDLRELKTAFNWLISRRLCFTNPCAGIEEYEEDSFVRYVPPPEDINAVLLEAEPWEYDFLQCIYHTAARRGEIQRLKWEDINFQTARIILWTMKRKGGSLEPDELSMNSVFLALLENRYRTRHRESPYVFPNNAGEVISKYTLDNIMPRLCRKADVKPFGFHAIRHHVSAIMADSKKLSLVQIQKQLRHKRTTTTDLYLKSFTGDETGAAGVLEKAQKKEIHTKVHTIHPKKKAGSE